MITPDFIPQNTIMEVNFEAEQEHKGQLDETAIRLAVTISARLISVNLC